MTTQLFTTLLTATLAAASLSAQIIDRLPQARDSRQAPELAGAARFGAYDLALKAAPEMAAAGTDVVIPLVMNAEGLRTTILLVNHDATPADYDFAFVNPSGGSLQVGLADGSRTAGLRGRIPANGTVEIRTSGRGTGETGWAFFSTRGGKVVGQASLESLDPNTGTWLAASFTAGNFFAPRATVRFDNRDGYRGALILVNLDSSATRQVTLTLRGDDGGVITTFVGEMGPLSQASAVLPEMFATSANRTGRVEVSVASGQRGGIVILNLNYLSDQKFSTQTGTTLTEWVR